MLLIRFRVPFQGVDYFLLQKQLMAGEESLLQGFGAEFRIPFPKPTSSDWNI